MYSCLSIISCLKHVIDRHDPINSKLNQRRGLCLTSYELSVFLPPLVLHYMYIIVGIAVESANILAFLPFNINE